MFGFVVLGVGLLLSAASCSIPSVKTAVNDPLGVRASSPVTRVELKGEILRFYKWLQKTRQLLHPVRPYHKTWPEPRLIDPGQKVKKPSPEEVQEELDKLMKNPDLKTVRS